MWIARLNFQFECCKLLLNTAETEKIVGLHNSHPDGLFCTAWQFLSAKAIKRCHYAWRPYKGGAPSNHDLFTSELLFKHWAWNFHSVFVLCWVVLFLNVILHMISITCDAWINSINKRNAINYLEAKFNFFSLYVYSSSTCSYEVKALRFLFSFLFRQVLLVYICLLRFFCVSAQYDGIFIQAFAVFCCHLAELFKV